MDPITLAGGAVGLLAPYLQQLAGKVVGQAAEQLSEAALSAVRPVYEAVKARLHPGSFAGTQLAGMVEKPDSPTRRRALQGALAAVLVEDEEFAAELERLVADACQAAGWQAPGGRVQGTAAFGGGGEVHQRAGRRSAR